MDLSPISYEALSSRQQEAYNYAKLASILADYGYTCVRLHDDYESGDLLALKPGHTYAIQLKGRFTIDKKYINKGLYMAWPAADRQGFYVVRHASLVQIAQAHTNIMNTRSWAEQGLYSIKTLSADLRAHLTPHLLPPTPAPLTAAADHHNRVEFGPK